MPMTPQQALQHAVEGRELAHDDMVAQMRAIMAGEVPPALIAAWLAALRTKRETVGEIAAAATVMRELVLPVHVAEPARLVDIVGTGGDGTQTFNISTASMFVVAAAGACVAKHGNRSVSSKSGSADVLEALGANIELSPNAIAASIIEAGIGFMFAPRHHPAMKNVGPVRRELGIRTLFNILGPLTNPASAPNVLMGVFSAELVPVIVHVLQRLGTTRAMVVHGGDGMDEITLGAATRVAELRDGQIHEYDLHPEDYGLPMTSSRRLRVENADDSRQRVLDALTDHPGPGRDIVCLNAGAALYVAGVVPSIGDGVALARETIASGAARTRLQVFAAASQRLAAEFP